MVEPLKMTNEQLLDGLIQLVCEDVAGTTEDLGKWTKEARAAVLARMMPGWQPIADLPDDVRRGRQLLVGHDTKRWIRFGRWFGNQSEWYYSGTNERSQWAQTQGDGPTHWQLLPDAPFAPVPAPPAGGGDHG